MRKFTVGVVSALFVAALLTIVLVPKAVQAINPRWWSPLASGTTQGLIGVWGTSATDVFAVGGGGHDTPPAHREHTGANPLAIVVGNVRHGGPAVAVRGVAMDEIRQRSEPGIGRG